ncbi:MAG: amino acid ABC transporter substrate-binding protein [Thermodesulfobacteriota bacterium]
MGGKKSLTWLGLFFFLWTVCLISSSGVSAAGKNEILVGVPNSLTGSNAMNGAEQKWAYEQAVADINKRGGVFVKELNKKLPIKLIFADDKSNNAESAAAMEKLIKVNKVNFALSSSVGPLTEAAATVCDKYKVYFAVTCCWPHMIEGKFKWATDFFFTAPGAAEVPFQIWKTLLPEADKIERPVLMMQDNQDGQGLGEVFKHWAKEYGYTFVVDEPYAVGAKDFSSQILKWKAQNADALIWFGSPLDSITVVRQIKEHNMNFKYIHGWMGFWATEFLKALGKDSNYIIMDAFWSEHFPNPGAKELGQQYTKKFGKSSVSIGLYHANPQVLAQGIEKAGSLDPAKVRDAVIGGEFKGTTIGDLKFNEKGIALIPSLALQWWNGERMPVWPLVKGGYTLKMMTPWDKR